MYQYAILDPRPSGADANDTILSSAPVGVYGIEVTVPALAARCQLGNLDPQHTEGRNVAACVAALTCPLPPDGATLVTVRPDADSVLAMAVLELRRRDATVREDRVHLIGQADSAPAGPWVRGYRPPAVFAAVSAVAMDHGTPLERRVGLLISWAAGADRLLPEPPDPMANDDAPHAELSACGRYAIVHADGPAGRGACAAGYQLAPTVIAVNQAFQFSGGEPHLKYTIARWNATHVPMDWAGMLDKLQTLEPGWGGSGSICGSPQGVGSTLTLDQVTATVERHLTTRWTAILAPVGVRGSTGQVIAENCRITVRPGAPLLDVDGVPIGVVDAVTVKDGYLVASGTVVPGATPMGKPTFAISNPTIGDGEEFTVSFEDGELLTVRCGNVPVWDDPRIGFQGGGSDADLVRPGGPTRHE